MLNKNGSKPLYIQLKNILREKIINGYYKEGDLIPSETKLLNKYNITRFTIRKAIDQLVNEGLVYRVHGKGTYVCFKEAKYFLWNFGGITDYFRKRKEKEHSKVLEKEIITFEGEKCLKLTRARGVEKEGKVNYITIDKSILSLKTFPEIDKYDFSEESLYNTMRKKYGIYPTRAELGMVPFLSTEKIENILSLENKIPLLKAVGKVFSQTGQAIEDVEVIYGPKVICKLVSNMR